MTDPTPTPPAVVTRPLFSIDETGCGCAVFLILAGLALFAKPLIDIIEAIKK